MTPEERDKLSDEMVAKAAEGCCANDEWRGRLCSYHLGLQDGIDAALALLEDCTWCPAMRLSDDER